MKDLKIFFLCVAASLTALYSCSNDEKNTDEKHLSFTGTIGNMTRAQATTWDAGDAIGIYMKNASGFVNGAENVKYTTGGDGAFTPATTGINFPADGSKVGFVAYYPHKGTLAADNTYLINVATQSPLSAIDLLYANNVTEADKSNPTVALQFKHQLSLLVLNITAGAGVSIDGLTASIAGLKVDGSFKIADGSLTLGSTEANITPVVNVTGTTGAVNAILVPGQNLQSAEITLTAGDKTWVLNSAKLPSTTFVSGKKYVYDVTLAMQSVSAIVDTDGITDWEDGNTGGTIDPVTPEVPEEEVTLDGYSIKKYGTKYWMTENLNEKGNDGTLGRYYNDEEANGATYGRLYTWHEAMTGIANCTAEQNPYVFGSTGTDAVGNAYTLNAEALGVQIQGVCPEGWHLPNSYDIYDLVVSIAQEYGLACTLEEVAANFKGITIGSDRSAAGGLSMNLTAWGYAGAYLKGSKPTSEGGLWNGGTTFSYGGNATFPNSSEYPLYQPEAATIGFNLLPGGRKAGSSYSQLGQYAYFWSSYVVEAGKATRHNSNYNNSNFSTYTKNNPDDSMYVRCVRNY